MTTTEHEHDPATCEICAGAVKEGLLRAAAPDLLAALERFIEGIEWGRWFEQWFDDFPEVLDQMKAAVAKAGGNSGKDKKYISGEED